MRAVSNSVTAPALRERQRRRTSLPTWAYRPPSHPMSKHLPACRWINGSLICCRSPSTDRLLLNRDPDRHEGYGVVYGLVSDRSCAQGCEQMKLCRPRASTKLLHLAAKGMRNGLIQVQVQTRSNSHRLIVKLSVCMKWLASQQPASVTSW